MTNWLENRKVIEEMFSTLGCKVYSAENGKEGLDIFKQYNDFDLVILDIQIPIMDGKKAFYKIRKCAICNHSDYNATG